MEEKKNRDPIVAGAFKNQPLCLGLGNVLYPTMVCHSPEEWQERLKDVEERGQMLNDEAYSRGYENHVGFISLRRKGGYLYAYMYDSYGDLSLELAAPEYMCEVSQYCVIDAVY